MDNQKDYSAEILKYVKRQTRFSIIAAFTGIVAVIVLILVAVTIVPQLTSLITNAEQVLVVGEKSIQNAMGMMEKVDLETLNNAIVELEKVIKPLSDFFGMFGN